MEYKPLLLVLIVLSSIGLFLNVFIVPNVSNNEPDSNSALSGLIDFIEDGYSFTVPIAGSVTFYPSIFWLGIDIVSDWITDNLTALSYLPDMYSIPIVILLLLSFIFVILGLISLLPFT